MKFHTKPALRVMPAAQVQISLPVQGVLRDVRHAFLGLCIDVGQKVLGAMMEADRTRCAGPRECPTLHGGPCVAAAPPVSSYWAASALRCADREPA